MLREHEAEGSNPSFPTTVHLYSFFIAELREKLSAEDFTKLQSKIHLIPDDENPFLAIDEEGNKFDYPLANSLPSGRKKKPLDWLGIQEPEYYD